MSITIISFGWCKCTHDPMCKGGLEGYTVGSEHTFERCEDDKGRYIRLYMDGLPVQYDTCGPGIFKTHFEVIGEESAGRYVNKKEKTE